MNKLPVLLSTALLCLLFAVPASAQYQQTNIESNGFVSAEIINSNLINPWGISSSAAGSPFWISDQASNFQNPATGVSSAVSTLLTVPSTGAAPSIPGLIVNVPNQMGAAANPATNGPTGQVATGALGITTNAATDFQVVGPNGGTANEASFIFANKDGSISAWAAGNSGTPIANTTATLEVSVAGASFTGLAIANSPSAEVGGASGAQIFAADQNSGNIDVFNSSFQKIGSFTDPNLPAGYTAFNVQNLNGILFVTYANQNNPQGGIVDEFAPDGTFLGRLIDDSSTTVPEHLQLPWGVTIAPSTFGQFAGDLLVGNAGGNGEINAFNLTTGAFVGALTLSNGQVFSEDNLKALMFGTGGSGGNPNTLFFTAGGPGGTNGLFGSLAAVPEPSSMLLVGIGGTIVGIVQFRRRKLRTTQAAPTL
jgi:uncharacterized protein (TIGR03118 family)